MWRCRDARTSGTEALSQLVHTDEIGTDDGTAIFFFFFFFKAGTVKMNSDTETFMYD